MSTESADRQQQKVRDFMALLPLTVEIAGLGRAETGKHLNEGQMEARANSIRLAYKFARQLLLEMAK